MRIRPFLLMLALIAGLTACTTETYPVSGEECGPEDPVQDLDASAPCPTGY
ncbi:MAG: hypothetical protein ACPGID_12220 [Rubricella sp.]